jgi:two-component system chemotaxis response regulator CheY
MNFDIKVLVVDDFATMRRIIKNALKEIGFKNIREAEDGKNALNLMKKENIGLVLSDWNMPNMNGLDLLKSVRDDENLTDTPFIMVTAEGQKDNIIEAVKFGVNNYIMKPFTADTIREKIEKVL